MLVLHQLLPHLASVCLYGYSSFFVGLFILSYVSSFFVAIFYTIFFGTFELSVVVTKKRRYVESNGGF